MELDELISWPVWNRIGLASGKFYVLWNRIYAFLLYRYDLCIYSGSGGEIEIFVRETTRSLS